MDKLVVVVVVVSAIQERAAFVYMPRLALRATNDSSSSNSMTNGHAGCFGGSESKVHLRGETFQCSISRMVEIVGES